MTFKLGEIAIIIRSTRHPELVGSECEIMSGLIKRPDGCEGYLIHIPGCPAPPGFGSPGQWFAQPGDLRKKKPPEELSTWEEFEKLTGFKPEDLVIASN